MFEVRAERSTSLKPKPSDQNRFQPCSESSLLSSKKKLSPLSYSQHFIKLSGIGVSVVWSACSLWRVGLDSLEHCVG